MWFSRLFSYWSHPCLLRRVLVNTTEQVSFRAVVWETRRSFVVLKNVEAITPDGRPPQKVDGDVVIDRSRITFYQVAD